MSITDQARVITDKLHSLQAELTPTLRKMTKAATKRLRREMAAVTPRGKPRRVNGVMVQPGLMQGAVGESVWTDATTGTVRGKVGQNVDRERAPSATTGIPGKHKAYWGAWNILGTEDRFTGSKTRRRKIGGVIVKTKVSTGHPVRYTGRIRQNLSAKSAAAASMGAARQAARDVLHKAIKDL